MKSLRKVLIISAIATILLSGCENNHLDRGEITSQFIDPVSTGLSNEDDLVEFNQVSSAKTVEECERLYEIWQKQNPMVMIDWIGCEVSVARNLGGNDLENKVIFMGHELTVEHSDQILKNEITYFMSGPGAFSPLIRPLNDGLLVQFYSNGCVPEISLIADSGEVLKVVVNYNAEMEQNPQLMACNDIFKSYSFRIKAEEILSNDFEINWENVAENAQWTTSTDLETNDDLEVLWDKFVLADEILVED